MKKRIFIGIKISDELAKEILDWKKPFWKSFAKTPLRWIEGKDLHITLIPPWHMDEEEVEWVKQKLGAVQGMMKPFDIEFKKVIYGPSPKHPRLIWAEGQTPQEIVDLKTELEKIS